MEPEAPTTRLVIEVRDGPEAPPRRWTLTCDPAGGDHPDPEGACLLLASAADRLAPVPPDRRCAQRYFGPERATVVGLWRGTPVHAELRRTDSCEEGRWRALSGLWRPSPR